MPTTKNKKARVLFYDIETAPNLVYTWGVYEQNVLEVVRPWYILCFAYKWLGESTTHVVSLNDFPSSYKKNPEDDYQVVNKLHELFNEADIVVAHNGNNFDQKKVSARFLVHGFDPPMHYKQIDTLKEARKHFKFDSNRLNDLSTILGIGKKAQTGGFQLWKDCMNGDIRAWNKMKKYNKQDVVLLEEVYQKLLPWVDNHPNISVLNETMNGCPKCGSFDLQKRGIRHNKTTSYQQYQCQSCRGFCRERTCIKKEIPQYVN